jgi:hypothetical protein
MEDLLDTLELGLLPKLRYALLHLHHKKIEAVSHFLPAGPVKGHSVHSIFLRGAISSIQSLRM